MAAAGRLAAEILDRIAPMIVPEVSTAEIDKAIEDMVNEAGATSATIGYKGVAQHVFPGTTTGAIDDWIRTTVEASGAVSATIGYKGYRHATCISVNHVVCHGIPSEKRLKPGDILNIDVTVIVDG
ncbi:MAG: M24 family metallopeptidase, partial [Rhodobacteraceae bacterium]|nr:M24 family metallopeptidase [Paracoccaceae bacterium]